MSTPGNPTVTLTRNLSEFAVSDTPAPTPGPGGDYLAHHHRREGGLPSALGQGIPGGSGPVDTREQEATHYMNEGEPLATKQNENEDADEQMAPPAEGEVARAVEERTAQSRRQDGGPSPSPQAHGRARGEVTLEASEAGLERKKAQQEVARRRVMDARRRGEDVDGRGAAGPSGRQPRAEID